MSSTMKDGARLYAVAFSPAPVHIKGFAFMYCHDDLRGGEMPALDRARRSVSEYSALRPALAPNALLPIGYPVQRATTAGGAVDVDKVALTEIS